jgi:hypothetical protein
LLGAAEIMVLDYLSLVCEHNYYSNSSE